MIYYNCKYNTSISIPLLAISFLKLQFVISTWYFLILQKIALK